MSKSDWTAPKLESVTETAFYYEEEMILQDCTLSRGLYQHCPGLPQIDCTRWKTMETYFFESILAFLHISIIPDKTNLWKIIY